MLPALQDGRPFTAVLSERLEKLNQPVILATGTSDEDSTLVDFYSKKLPVYRGYDKSVPHRVLEAGKELNCDAVVSVDGDDIFVSLEAIEKVITQLQAGEKLVSTDGLPFGMNAWGFQLSYLEECLKDISGDTIETGWGRVFDADASIIKFDQHSLHEQLRFSLDYPEDQKFFSSIFEKLDSPTDANDKEILNLVETEKLYEINEAVIPLYWENFHAEKAMESKQ